MPVSRRQGIIGAQQARTDLRSMQRSPRPAELPRSSRFSRWHSQQLLGLATSRLPVGDVILRAARASSDCSLRSRGSRLKPLPSSLTRRRKACLLVRSSRTAARDPGLGLERFTVGCQVCDHVPHPSGANAA